MILRMVTILFVFSWTVRAIIRTLCNEGEYIRCDNFTLSCLSGSVISINTVFWISQQPCFTKLSRINSLDNASRYHCCCEDSISYNNNNTSFSDIIKKDCNNRSKCNLESRLRNEGNEGKATIHYTCISLKATTTVTSRERDTTSVDKTLLPTPGTELSDGLATTHWIVVGLFILATAVVVAGVALYQIVCRFRKKSPLNKSSKHGHDLLSESSGPPCLESKEYAEIGAVGSTTDTTQTTQRSNTSANTTISSISDTVHVYLVLLKIGSGQTSAIYDKTTHTNVDVHLENSSYDHIEHCEAKVNLYDRANHGIKHNNLYGRSNHGNKQENIYDQSNHCNTQDLYDLTDYSDHTNKHSVPFTHCEWRRDNSLYNHIDHGNEVSATPVQNDKDEAMN